MEIDIAEKERLCEAVEQKARRKMEVHGDYEYLSELIFEALHLQISATTLKRFWGKLDEAVVPRRSTLDILAQYVGAEDWTDFVDKTAPKADDAPSPTDTPDVPVTASSAEGSTETASAGKRPLLGGWRGGLLGVLLLGALLLGAYYWGSRAQEADGRYILRKGQTFATYADYLRMFGVTTNTRCWDQQVPHYPFLRLWGPQYNHPEWHNTGNPDSLMPTIAEYWEPTNIQGNEQAKQVVEEMNKNTYLAVKRINEVRLTFMYDMPAAPSRFVFLGVYRMSFLRSDSTRVVWERVADEVDMRHLDYLERFRN